MNQEHIKQLKEIEYKYKTSEEEIKVHHLSKYLSEYLTYLFRDSANKTEWKTGIFYFSPYCFDKLILELDSNIRTLQSEKFQQKDIEQIFKRLYLKEFDNIVRIPNLERMESEEDKTAQNVHIHGIPNNLFRMMQDQKDPRYIPTEIVNKLFTANMVSFVKVYTLVVLEAQKGCFIKFCTQERAEIEDIFKKFSRETNISLDSFDIYYAKNAVNEYPYGFWLYGKNLGLFLHAVSSLINKFNNILSSTIFLPKNVQPSIFLNIIADYCDFNYKISEQEISGYLSFSDLFRVSSKNPFKNPDGLGLEEATRTSIFQN
jgi:hypothetical protein